VLLLLKKVHRDEWMTRVATLYNFVFIFIIILMRVFLMSARRLGIFGFLDIVMAVFLVLYGSRHRIA
jgi:hypothetical protein